MFRRLLILFFSVCLGAVPGLPGRELLAQDQESSEESSSTADESTTPADENTTPADEDAAVESEEAPAEEEVFEEADFEPEPMSPREALFLAIELKDVEAARRALREGADEEISLGDPSPLATAALHNDLLMVRLLLSFGGDPGAAVDSPLEEAIRNENPQMVELFLRSGADVPHAERGRELFWLAQRGEQAIELSGILLDHSGNPDLCLIAAAQQGRADVMKYCLSRGGDVGAMPQDLNLLSVALGTGDSDFVAQIVGEGLQDRVIAGALPDAIAAGDLDLVRKAVASGATLDFSHIEAAVETKHPDIGIFLLDQSEPDDPTVLAGGDVDSLIQQADDLGYTEVAAALRRKSGVSWLSLERLLPIVVLGLLMVSLIALLVKNFRRRREPATLTQSATLGGVERRSLQQAPAPLQQAPAAALQQAPAPLQQAAAPQQQAAPSRQQARPASPSAPTALPAVPAVGAGALAPPVSVSSVPASEVPVAPVMPIPAPAVAEPVSPPLAASPVPASADSAADYATTVLRVDQLPLPAAQESAELPPQQLNPARPVSDPIPVPADPAPAEAWQAVAEPSEETAPDPAAPLVVTGPAVPLIEVRMPEVDLTRRVESVFESARRAASSGDAQRSIVLVTPQRIPMLYPCPAPGSVPAADHAAAERLAPAALPRNVVAIAFNDLETASQDIRGAIPFFDLLRTLGFLGHSVWIFEGHVSAMQAGCQEADLLIVDDGMVPYLPGNWRSVASRAMRGSEVTVFERKSGTLRRLR